METRSLKAVFALLAVVSCTSATVETDIPDPIRPEDRIFEATIEDGQDGSTKVFLNSDLTIRWTEDDRISIFCQSPINEEFRFLGQTGDASGKFRAVETEEFSATSVELNNYYAVYPYRESTSFREEKAVTGEEDEYFGTMNVTLPAQQAYLEDSFALGANTMVSSSTTKTLKFKNLCGFLQLKLYGNDITVQSIVFKGNRGEKLAGAAMVATHPDDVPSVTVSESGTDQIEIVCDPAVTLGTSAEDYTNFYFVIPPTVFAGGFTIVVTDENGYTFTKSIGSSFEIQRNHISPKAPLQIVPDIPVSSISLDKTELTLPVGASEALQATVLPDNAADKTVTWTSSDPSVAEVGVNGQVAGISVGEATITATAGDKTAQCVVTVTPVAVERIELDKTSLIVKLSDYSSQNPYVAEVVATVYPENASYDNVEWSVSPSTNCPIGSSSSMAYGAKKTKFRIRPVSLGTAILTASIGEISASCEVTVINPVQEFWLEDALENGNQITEITVEYDANNPNSQRAWIYPKYSPANCDGMSYSENGGPCEVSYVSGAEVSIAYQGTASTNTHRKSYQFIRLDYSQNTTTVSLTTKGVNENGQPLTATCIIHWPKRVTQLNIQIPGGSSVMETRKDETVHYTYSVYPTDAANKTVTWESSNETIATVDQEGNLTGVKEGRCNITIRATDGSGVFKTVEAWVKPKMPNAIDLGLPSGTKWADVDMGAENGYTAGLKYAWGEIDPKESFEWSNYKYYKNGTCTPYQYTVLNATDDAAYKGLSTAWRIPTKAQFDELLQYTTVVTQSFPAGYVTLRSTENGAEITLYVGGHWLLNRYDGDDEKALIFVRNVTEYPNDLIKSGAPWVRYDGLAIRPVTH